MRRKTMSDEMKCLIRKPGDSKKVTVYTAKWCGACKKEVAMIQNLALLYRFTVELVDVDNKDPEVQKRVQHVRFVPHIEYLGEEISFDELVKTFKDMDGLGDEGQSRGAS